MLITTANLDTFCDKLCWVWARIKPHMGLVANQSSPVQGTAQYFMNDLLNLIVATADDFQQQQDMGSDLYSALTNMNIEKFANNHLKTALQTLNDHINDRGSSVDSSIQTLDTFLAYYNGGSGGAKFANLQVPELTDLWNACFGANLDDAGIMAPAIHPNVVSGASANGMGLRAVGVSFADGDDVNTTLYSPNAPKLEVTVDFAGGGSAPVISVAGTDDTGATDTTWDVTLGSNNPTAAVSTTLTPAVTTIGRQTLVAVGSATGIVIGSVLGINAGEDDEEYVIVENVSGSTITFVAAKTHSAGAALTGFTTVALTPSVSSRRPVSLSGITITTAGHTAGTVRVISVPERVAA